MVVRVWRQACEALDRARDRRHRRQSHCGSGTRRRRRRRDDLASAHQSGTDRIAEVAARIEAEIYLNVQGDQPFIAPADLDALAAPMRADPSLAMATLATPITDEDEWHNPNEVKVVCDARGDALYFSRSPIPFRARRRHAGDSAAAYRGLRAIGGTFCWPSPRLRAGCAEADREARTVARTRARLSHQGGGVGGAFA